MAGSSAPDGDPYSRLPWQLPAAAARRRVPASQAPAAPVAGAAQAPRQASLVREFKQAWEAGNIEALIVTVFAFDVAGDRITHIWAVRHPDKLRPWTTG